MTKVGDGFLRFDFGLSGVRQTAEIARLPDHGTAPAIDTQPIVAIEALFQTETAETAMLSATTPDLAARVVLEPANYAAALDVAVTLLLERATVSQGEMRQVFADALTVVEDAVADRSVLDRARLALLRG